jgi:hypothetical protein
MSTLSQFLGTVRSLDNAFITLVAGELCINPFTQQGIGVGNPLGCTISASGGNVICKASNILHIVAPSSTQVSRTWYCREDAVTIAKSRTTNDTQWFIPTVSQLQNPGYCCRTYWDSFSSSCYWSSTETNATFACGVTFVNGNACSVNKNDSTCVRAFRCVTY